MQKRQSKFIFGLENVNSKAVFQEMAKMWFNYSLSQSLSINRDRDRGGRESVGYRLGHCAYGYRERSIMGAQKKCIQEN